MKGLRNLSTVLLLATLTAGCTQLLNSQAATPFTTEYIPTAIALTVAAGQTEAIQFTPEPIAAATGIDPTAAASPNVSPTLPEATVDQTQPTSTVAGTPVTIPINTSDSPTATLPSEELPALTPTPNIPNAAIQFAAPGPMSRVVSPLEVTATVRTVAGGSFRIELWAEPLLPDGEPRLLLREVHNFIDNPIDWMFIDQALEFELARVSELAELRIQTFDRFGRPVAAASVELVLLQIGESQLNPSGDVQQSLIINEPVPNILIQGGTMIITGIARPLNNQPLLVELVAADGIVAGFRQIFLSPGSSGEYIPFNAEVPYSVTSPTWVRLILSQSGVRIPGIRQLNSLEVLLSP